jgi:hypothetical protein
MQAIGEGYPAVQCDCIGDGSIYSNIISTGGDPIPDQATLDAWILSQTKTSMWLLIQGERDRRKSSGGYKVNVSGTDYWFHSDDTSRIQQIALVMFGTNMPTGIMWKTMSGSFVEMTPTLASQIFQAATASDISIFTIAEQKKQEMLASATPGTYDYLSGWPMVYGE